MSSSTAVQPAENRSRGRLVIFGLILFAFGLLLALMFFGLQLRGAPPLASGTAPAFELTTFDGQSLSLAGLRGKPIVLNFWASWCVPCRDEAPALERAWQKYKDEGLMVIGVDYVDTDPEAKRFIAEFKQTYPNGPDLGTRISQDYRISGVPETYFVTRDGKMLPGIDSQGHVNANWIGPIPEESLLRRIELLLMQ